MLKRLKVQWLQRLLCAIGLTLSMVAFVQASDKQKAELLYKFAVYVQSWGAKKTLTFCVVGSSDFTTLLKNHLADKKIGGRDLITKEGNSNCDVLFGYRRAVTGEEGVLTVSDVKDFAENGGMIEILDDDNSFNISNQAARSKGVKISSDLLKIAKKTR